MVIPEGVEEIKNYAFYNCTSIKNITMPKSLKSIGMDVFYGCNSIDSVYITDLAAWCNIDFNDEDSNPMVYSDLYINGVLATDIVIPDGVEEIKKYSFKSCESITSVTIPDSVKTIGNYAFSYCKALAELKIGKNITSIGSNAFYNDKILKVYITNLAGWCGIDFKNDYANPLGFAENFYINGEDVTDIVIPDGVEEIKQYAFYKFDEMTTLKLSDTVKKIGLYAFFLVSPLKKWI